MFGYICTMDENSRGSNDSVELDPSDQDLFMNGHMDIIGPYSPDDNGTPRLEIVEQPQQRGFRFRYECEGPSHGGLQGNSTEKFRKTVPTVRIRNYKGPARIIATLVTDETVPKPHAHKLVGRHCHDGRCSMDVKAGTPQITFPNLCIQHVTRRKASEVLQQRICDSLILHKKISLNDFSCSPELTNEERKTTEIQAEKQAKDMKLNVVRLCFQAFLVNSSNIITKMLEPVISDPIYDSKAPGANALKICRMDKYSGCCTGGEEVFLLCEKVQRDDIMVRFVEQDQDGNVVWESFGNFGPFDVHRQFAIVFKTPEYKDTNIKSQVNVLVMLQRKSDSETSDPKSFTYHPKSHDKEDIIRKRKKVAPFNPGGGGFNDMDTPGNFPGNSDNTNGNSNMNGSMHNGTLPNFHNMSLIQSLGNRPLISGNHSHGHRQILQAARKSPQMQQVDFKPQLSSMGHPDITFMSQPQQFVFEEVSTLSPPGPDPGATYMNQTSQGLMGNQQVSAYNVVQGSSPDHMAMSPMSYHGSPQQYTVSSPQMVPLSSHNLLDQTVGHLQAQSMSYQSQHPIMSGSLPVTDTLLVNDSMQPTTEAIQATTSISSDNLDLDFIISHTAEFAGTCQMYAGQQELIHTGGMDNPFQMYSFGPDQSCSYMARGGSSSGLDFMEYGPGLDCLDGMSAIKVGHDEVDASVAARFHVDAQPAIDDSQSDRKLYARQASITKRSHEMVKKEKHVKQTAVDMRQQPRPCVSDAVLEEEEKVVVDENLDVKSPKIKVEVVQESVVSSTTAAPPTIVTTSEHGDVEAKQHSMAAPRIKIDTAAQTEMDSNMMLALKMSQALHHYAGSGDVRALLMVQRYLMAVQDNNGDLPLHTALINQRYEVFQNILDVMVALPDSYSRINAYNFHHQTPLHLAVLTNQPYAVDLLVRAGADSTLVDRNGYTPAHLAVLYGCDDCLRNLVKFLRPDCTQRNPFPELNLRCYDGFTPCHLAALNGNLSAMKILVYGRADVNLPDGKCGRSPLHHAVEVDELSIAAYLILQAGANVNGKRFDGNTPLHIACGRGNVGMVALLMAGGADPNVENEDIEECVEIAEREEEEEEEVTVEKTETGQQDADTVTVGSAKDDSVDDGDKDDKDADDTDKDDSTEKPTGAEKTGRKHGRGDKNNNRFGSHRHKGLTPADFASNNEKILRILNGEPYSRLQEDAVKQTADSLASLTMSNRTESGIGSLASDLEKLDYPTRLELSELLDPSKEGQDWLALAEKLGLKNLVDGQLGKNSPTRLLLTYFEESGGTLSRLTQALTELNRLDALSVLAHTQTHEHTPASQDIKLVVKDPQFDSGHVESCRKTPSPSPSPYRGLKS